MKDKSARRRFLLAWNRQILCDRDGTLAELTDQQLASIPALLSPPSDLGSHENTRYWLAVPDQAADLPYQISGCQWCDLRTQLGRLPDAMFSLAGKAVQLSRWEREHRFCGQCGSRTERLSGERAFYCPACQLRFYPRIAPCMIVLVTQGEYCLLAQHTRSSRPFHTALAGFVEVGERVEDTVHREVEEEVGLQVDQLQYFGSQAWPFPGQLMLGFHARMAGGMLHLDPTEIATAAWWHYRDLPPVPPPETLSGQLIADFVHWHHN